ncbi:MAG: hypothetical protein V4567_08025 [Pseudomonadota bacterium]
MRGSFLNVHAADTRQVPGLAIPALMNALIERQRYGVFLRM